MHTCPEQSPAKWAWFRFIVLFVVLVTDYLFLKLVRVLYEGTALAESSVCHHHIGTYTLAACTLLSLILAIVFREQPISISDLSGHKHTHFQLAQLPIGATTIIIALWIVALTRGFDPDDTTIYMENNEIKVIKNTWFQDFYHNFIHGSWSHLISNSTGLIVMYVFFENRYGSFAYLISFIFPALFVLNIWSRGFNAVGASGALWGILGSFTGFRIADYGRFHEEFFLYWFQSLIIPAPFFSFTLVSKKIEFAFGSVDNTLYSTHGAGYFVGIGVGLCLSTVCHAKGNMGWYGLGNLALPRKDDLVNAVLGLSIVGKWLFVGYVVLGKQTEFDTSCKTKWYS